MTDHREPVTWLNYKGDRRQILDGGPLGPTAQNELVYPVSADYDDVADRTRVGFSFHAPEVTE